MLASAKALASNRITSRGARFAGFSQAVLNSETEPREPGRGGMKFPRAVLL
jgi:hypothetical protein